MQGSDHKILKRVLSVVLIVVFFVTGTHLLGDAMTPLSYALYFNHDMDEIRAQKQDVDLLFVGGSRVYRSYVPEVFEEKLGIGCAVNAGGSSQPTVGTYYQLKDMLEHYNVRRVLIGVSLTQLIGFYDANSTQGSLIVYDRIDWKNRLHLLWDAFRNKSRWLYGLYAYRFRDNLTKIPSILEERQGIIDSGYEPVVSGEEYYADTGFVYSYVSYETGTIPISANATFSEDKINEDKKYYLDACVDLCQKKGVQVDLVTGPTTVMRMYVNKSYQTGVDYFHDYAASKGIQYYNLNYLIGREEFLPDEMMFDRNHVNGEGAQIISNRFADILVKADAGEDVSSYFYKNLDEFKAEVHRVVALEAEIERDKEKNTAAISITSLQNDDVIPQYRIEVIKKGEEDVLLADWTEESELNVKLPYEGKLKIRVTARTGIEGDRTASQTYTVK